MSSTLEALKKKREDLKAKLLRRKEISGTNATTSSGGKLIGSEHFYFLFMISPIRSF